MAVLGPDLAKGHPDGEPSVKPGVGQEDLTRPVDRLEERLVEGVESFFAGLIGLAGGARRCVAQADRRERGGCQPLEVGVGVDPRGQGGCLFDVGSDPPSKAFQAEPSEQHPELQGTEPAPELRRVLVHIPDR